MKWKKMMNAMLLTGAFGYNDEKVYVCTECEESDIVYKKDDLALYDEFVRWIDTYDEKWKARFASQQRQKGLQLVDIEYDNKVFYADSMSDEDRKQGKSYFQEIADDHRRNESEMIADGSADLVIDSFVARINRASTARELYDIAREAFDERGLAIIRLEEER